MNEKKKYFFEERVNTYIKTIRGNDSFIYWDIAAVVKGKKRSRNRDQNLNYFTMLDALFLSFTKSSRFKYALTDKNEALCDEASGKRRTFVLENT